MERISTHQFLTLGSAVLLGGIFLVLASSLTSGCGRDGWVTVLPGVAIAVPYGLMVLSLHMQYPGKSLFQISEMLYGKWLGKIVNLIFMGFSCYFGGLLLALLGTIAQRTVMPLVPQWLFYLGTLFLILYLLASGIEVFARFTEVILPLNVMVLILLIVFAIPHIQSEQLMPILSEGIKPLFPGVFGSMAFTMEYILFMGGVIAFLPTGKQELSQLKAGVWRTTFMVGVLLMLSVIIQILVFGPAETIRLTSGLTVLGKMVEISRAVLGAESIFMGVWYGAFIIKICAVLFAVSWAIESIFNWKGFKWSLIVGAVFFAVALGFTRGQAIVVEIHYVQKYIIFPFTFVWVPSLWGIARWKKGIGR